MATKRKAVFSGLAGFLGKFVSHRDIAFASNPLFFHSVPACKMILIIAWLKAIGFGLIVLGLNLHTWIVRLAGGLGHD
ncbi:MAG: hypothetical protein V2B20_11325 [Pseudomonadota bacterium]